MKLLKGSFFVKSVYTYFNLFTKIYPLILLRLVGNSIGGQKEQGLFPSVDFYNLFSNEPELFSPNVVSWQVKAAIIISNLLVFGLTYFMIIQLNRFLRDRYEENPFIRENGKKLKTAGTLTIILALFISLKDVVLKAYLLDAPLTLRALLIPMNFIMGFFSPYFIIGMFTYALGEISIRAAKLKEEVELTV
ncbi:MAG TPA: DUF2975 domain-containing protein [Ignavibacteriales bacterium]|nr:DUF2975 domain-containing protein [Ignavibacteriales bacterium]